MSDDIQAEPAFALTPADLISPTWRRLEAHMKAQLQVQRRQNDNTKLDAVETAHVRGRIAALKNLLALATVPAIVADADGGE